MMSTLFAPGRDATPSRRFVGKAWCCGAPVFRRNKVGEFSSIACRYFQLFAKVGRISGRGNFRILVPGEHQHYRASWRQVLLGPPRAKRPRLSNTHGRPWKRKTGRGNPRPVSKFCDGPGFRPRRRSPCACAAPCSPRRRSRSAAAGRRPAAARGPGWCRWRRRSAAGCSGRSPPGRPRCPRCRR